MGSRYFRFLVSFDASNNPVYYSDEYILGIKVEVYSFQNVLFP